MSNNSPHLIYSSGEKTWSFDRPVDFLEEQLLLYSPRHISDFDLASLFYTRDY